MERKLLIKEAVCILESAGYKVVEIRNVHTCFDILAEKNSKKIIAKVVSNIDSVQKSEAKELSKLAVFIDAKPLIVGSASKNGPLETNIIYERFSVQCVSLSSLEGLLFDVNLMLATKGSKAKVVIDSNKFKRLISLNNMSIREVARLVHVSKDTLYKYSREGGFASLETAEKLKQHFNMEFEAGARFEKPSKIQLPTIKLGKMNIEAMSIRSAPFDIIAKGKNYYEISSSADARTLAKQSEILRKIFDVFESNYPFFILNSKIEALNGIPVLTRKRFNSVSSEEELLEEIEYKY